MNLQKSPSGTAIALVHFPVYNCNHEIVTTSVTTVDLHDIARAACTYGVWPFYVVTPITSQREMVMRIVDHWLRKIGTEDHPRIEAMAIVRVAQTLEEAARDLAKTWGQEPTLIATSARDAPNTTPFSELRALLRRKPEQPYLLVLGTGWGLAEAALAKCNLRIDPIQGPTHYNHLSVRCAGAIILDRLFGDA